MASAPAAAQMGVYQMYYVPVPETAARTFNRELQTQTVDEGRSILSISIVLPNTLIYWDHSEDGYESDVTLPTQATSEVWGDGDCSNGFHPSYPCVAGVGDVFAAGDVLVIDQTYNVTNTSAPTNNAQFANGFARGAQLRMNGGDRFGSSKALAVTRVFYNTTPGTLLAESLEVEAVSYWGTEYVLPVGQNTDLSAGPPAEGAFERVQAFVLASEPNTTIRLGTTTVLLQRGQTHVFKGIQQGDRVISDKPVQVTLMTGDVDASYESRWFRIPPLSLWEDEYYSPVAKTTHSGSPVGYWIHNAGAAAITVAVSEHQSVTSSLSIGAGETAYYQATSGAVGQYSGAHFQSHAGAPFYVMAAADAKSGASYDWGFSLVPASSLTGQTVLGWAPAYLRSGSLATLESSFRASPVWVTPVSATTICVDYDRDGTIDVAYNLKRLQSQRILDATDHDMTGALIYSVNKEGQTAGSGDALTNCRAAASEGDSQTDIAVVWGQDAGIATAGAPAIDAGNTVLSVPKYGVSKRLLPFPAFGDDADGSETVTPGDTVVYEVVVDNYGPLPLRGGVLTDRLPAPLEFVPGSETTAEWRSDERWGSTCSNNECVMNIDTIPAQSSAQYQIAARIPAGGGSAAVVSNSVVFAPPGGEPLEAGAPATVEYADVTPVLSGPAVYVPGDSTPLQVRVDFGNVGTQPANVASNLDGTGPLTYLVTISAADGWKPSAVSCPDSFAQCNYNASTGVLSFSGLPPTLASGQFTDTTTLQFDPPPAGAGAISVVSSLATTNLQPVGHLPDSATHTVVPYNATTQVDVTTTVNAPSRAQLGETVGATATFANQGSDASTGTQYWIKAPEGVEDLSCAAPATCSYDATQGLYQVTGAGFGTSLNGGASVPSVAVSYTATTTGSLTIETLVTSGNESIDAVYPNRAQAVTMVTALPAKSLPDFTVTINTPEEAQQGDSVTGSVVFSNVGAVAGEPTTYQVTLDRVLSGVTCSHGCSVNTTQTSTVLSWAAGSNGVPQSLAAGASAPTLSFTYTAPNNTTVGETYTVLHTAAVDVNSAVTEISETNNTASAPTRLTSSLADMAVEVTLSTQTTVLPGTPVTGQVVCTNKGPRAAAEARCEVTAPSGVDNWSVSNCSPATLPVASLAAAATIGCDISFTTRDSGPVVVTASTGADNEPDTLLADNTAEARMGTGVPDVYSKIELPTSAQAGERVTALVEFGNLPNGLTADGVTYQISGLPLDLTDVQCEVGSCAYDRSTGTVTVTGLPQALAGGQGYDVPLSWTIPADSAGSSYTLTSTITTTTTGNSLANDVASATLMVPAPSAGVAGEVMTSVWVPDDALPSATVHGQVRYHNLASVPVTEPVWRVTVDGAQGTPTVSFAGSVCTVAHDGVLSACGLPTELAVGASLELAVSYQMPADPDGVVTLTSTVSAANDTLQPNNTDVGVTRAAALPATPDVASSVSAPAVVAPGATVNVPVVFTNVGPEVATGVSYTVSLPPGLSGVMCEPACTYDSGTGAVTLTQPLVSLVPGESWTVTLSYTAPSSSGTQSITARTDAGNEAVEDTANNPSAALVRVVQPGTLDLLKTVYYGHDGGAQCATNTAKHVSVVEKDPRAHDITWCFRVTNTGPEALDQPNWNDPQLPGLVPVLLNGSLPLAPGATGVWFIESSHQASVVNTVSLDMTVTDDVGTPVPGVPTVTGSDMVETIFGMIYDPPFGVKLGSAEGRDVVLWTMVWVNDNVLPAAGVEVSDLIRAPMAWHTGQTSPVCTPYGTTVVHACEYDAVSKRVRAVADFGTDAGVSASDFRTAVNRLEISFRVTVPAGNTDPLLNQAEVTWTPSGETTPLTGSSLFVAEDGTISAQPSEVRIPAAPTISAVPAIHPFTALMLAFGVLGVAARQYRRRAA